MEIPVEVLDILRKGYMRHDIGQVIYFLPQGQLDRKMYLSVNNCLEALGCKWNRKLKGHIVENPGKLREALDTGVYTDAKKEFQFWETPEALARRMVEMAELKPADRVLEPSAGRGAIAYLIQTGKLWVNEINPEMALYLRQCPPTPFTQCPPITDVMITNYDFLAWGIKFAKGILFDKIIQNPPFRNNQDIAHIRHALKCLLPGGILVSLCSEHPFFARDNKSRCFRGFLTHHKAEVIKLEPGAFKSSGTMVNARIIKIKKRKRSG